MDEGTESMANEIDALPPAAAVNLVNEHHEEVEEQIMAISHDDHSLSGENIKTLPNVQYDPKGAAGFDLGQSELNIAQVPMTDLIEPPHKHPNQRGIDGGSQATGHNSGVVSAGSAEVDTSKPNDSEKIGMQGWFIVSLVLLFFFMLGCGLWCQWLDRVSGAGATVEGSGGVVTPHEKREHTATAPASQSMKPAQGAESML